MGTSSSRSLMRSRVVDDPTVRAELYIWSSAEFRNEYALVYTSRSNPSHTCVSHYRVNRDKVLFTFHDGLCEGNTVRLEMKFVGDRDNNGCFVLRYADADDSSGSFIEKRDQPSLFLLSYQDKFKCRIGELELNWGRREEYRVRFTTGIGGDSLLSCFVRVICNPFKGLDLDICGPHCERDDYIRRPVGLCSLDLVSGIPTHDAVKDKKQGNDVGASLASTQSAAILNAGQTQGNFNGSNFRDCKIVIDAQAIQYKGFHHST